MDQQSVAELNRIIRTSNHIVFFGGAGVSTESGIPDFRSKDGLYNQHDVKFDRYSPEYLLSIDCLIDHPDVFYEFYRQKLDTSGIEPNRAHYKLAEMEKAGKLDGIITQNIDGLHQRAGSRNVQEVHGSTLRNYCMKCHEKYPADFIFKAEGPIPKCPKCGGMVRPDVTLYGEGLPQTAWIESKRLVFRADCLIIGGTSLAVQPAASLAYDFSGENLIIINRDKTFADRNAKLVFHDNITEVLDSIDLED
ncbi:MAG: NAD-dependent protein deacylase [Saccharofermentans sp.]|nr:NAD-dependent protein deacylase [Saccharofermentans sp.]